MVNPLTRCVEDYSLPPFAQLRPDDIAPALRTAMAEFASDLVAIEDDLACPDAEISWESVMDRLEIIDDPLERLWSIVTQLMQVVNVPELRAAHADVQEEIVSLQSKRAQSLVVFQAMTTLRHSAAYESYTTEQQRILNRAIQRATLRGVNLVDNAKDRFNAILVRLKTLSTTHANNELDGTSAYSLIVTDQSHLEGVPLSTKSLLAQNAVAAGHVGATSENGPWKLSLELPVYNPVMKFCSNRSIRETLWHAFNVKANANELVVVEMLQLRHELAQLLGFATFAELSLANKVAPSVDAVLDTLEELRDKALPRSQAELRLLEEFAASHDHPLPLQQWDIPYWMERLRVEKYDIDDDAVRQYFPLPKVLDGLFDLVSQLFAIQIEAADGLEETWHPDVRFFQIRAMDQPETPVVAQFFLDPYARPGQKRQGSFVEVVVSRSKVLRTAKAPVRLPVFSIVLNQTPPVGDTPSLMTFNDLALLFGRVGIGLRIALTSAEYTAASGMEGIEMDALAVPVAMMKRFCYHSDFIQSISSHYQTHQPLPQTDLDKIVAAKRFMAGTTLTRQLSLAVIDLSVHHHHGTSATITADSTDALVEKIKHEFSALPEVHARDYMLCHFRHIFHGEVEAAYYKYIWSEIQAHDAYACFEDTQGDLPAWKANGKRFRDTILALSGVLHPTKAFELFRGRKLHTHAMLEQYGLL
ncbi:hypothetical protein H257_03300 [Aphanomyces astaci]|uniref:oligopeptidase A n=1 Tax=Aphanomyces astaci TaxID=112090 RepID=W4H2Z8_APHAT|nr:hypothetical protein H257_03300 [Aphanomyces astaci]ETV85594.1 hypothetical protein H257_03300 [Aphanomyces astaci]|eukprot:XP_009825612.1 hypothetical protein H257_03300 [Aphanomyces astaci]